MPDFNKIEDTAYVPMLGRIYASKNFPEILNDKKALELESKLPSDIKGKDTQTQYTLMAGAVRSVNMDRYIQDFISRKPDGIIVNIGCGLETTFFRNDNGKNIWYEIDLPEIIAYRKELIGESERDKCLVADGFGEEWIKIVRNEHPDKPILVTGSGLFYYFDKDTIYNLFKILKNYGDIEIVFDTVNSQGMKRIRKYMKQVGHEDAKMYFYLDSPDEIIKETNATYAKEEPYYSHTDKKSLDFITKATMIISDKFRMVKMVHVKLN